MKKTKEPKIIPQKEDSEAQKFIVGIGASAGGLEALQRLLTALPPDTGFPYVIIQHLSPDYKSLLGEILGKYTEMPVVQVENGVEIKPNQVYIIQPGKNMYISKGRLFLSPQNEQGLNLPIDMFFRSLAEEAGQNAIAIILSGTGSDGTNGIRDIKEHDGMIIVQDAETSKFDGMPKSAIRTGLVDAQLPPEAIAEELAHISATASKKPYIFKTELVVDEDLMKRIYVILKKSCNMNFTHYKQTTILRRLERRMMLVHKDDLNDYIEYLLDTPEEAKTLAKEVLIGVTNFFRDENYFQCLKEKAIQEIILQASEKENIRVWVAGCSTGEEAYSIAILFSEVMEALKVKRSVKIFATDLDVEAVTTASKGLFGDSIIDSVSPERLSKYFTRKNNTYAVNREIRQMIVFSPHNVIQDPPFVKLDLISCRNMLIYFQPVLQNDIFSLFHTSLKDRGYLFLGKSEAVGAFTEAFPVVDAAAKIFTHRSDVKIAGLRHIPFLQTSFLDDVFDERSRDSDKSEMLMVSQDEKATINNSLLEQFMPSCLVINETNDIVHLFGENSNYIHMPVGSFTSNVFKLVTEGLKIPASTILKEAREKKGKVQYKDIAFHGEKANAVINLTALPIGKINNNDDDLYALVFSETAVANDNTDAIPYNINEFASRRITDLEQDLSAAQNKLDKSIAEQECVNEELQAANEELLTANEELQSSNEELQSVNEELYTVNSEYQQKMTELANLNDDLANFLSSTLTCIIFVDNKLNIRRYTDYVTTEFSIMDHDIGRSLKFISYHFPTVDITEICQNVLKTLVSDEREIITSKNKVFFMRVAPYRSTENKILGCVLTLIDVTRQKQEQVQLASTEKKLSDATERLELKSDYFSRVAQQILSPLDTLKNLAKSANEYPAADEELHSVLGKIAETTEVMDSIVTEMTEFSNLEFGKSDAAAEPFALRNVVEKVSVAIQKDAQKAGLMFEVSIEDSFNPVYRGSSSAVQQVLLSFLNNAVKYTPKGGSIGLKTFELNGSSVTQPTVCFIVTDTGIGIQKDFISEVFKPFARDNVSGAEASKECKDDASMGLGLSIAKNLIDSMGGTVTVESEVDQGTTFTIHLPMMRYIDPNLKNPLALKDEKTLLKGCNVLVVDDNALNREILCNILSKEDMTFVHAADGEDAVRIFEESPAGSFDFVLMDMRMPRLDGIRATEQIRASSKIDAGTVFIIGVSANGFEGDIKKAFAAGMNKFTQKPINKDSLLSMMRELKLSV